MRFSWTAFLTFVIFSCAPNSREVEKTIVDIDGLIDLQLDKLQQRKPTLAKLAGVDALVSDSSWTPAAETWRNELEIFRALGMINQRIYEGTYNMEGPLDDAQSNLIIQQYANPSAPLRWLRLYCQDDPARIRRIEGEVQENNPLFQAQRHLSIWFEDDQGQPLLTRYEIVGFQKSALRDTVHFRIQSEVGW